MAIDLSTPEGRNNYLNDKLSDLINGVDSTYGNIIYEELLKRIESTIKDFNEEMGLVFDDIKSNEKKKQAMLLKLKKNSDPDKQDEKDRVRKEWEQKLIDLYSKDNKENSDTEKKEETNKKEAK